MTRARKQCSSFWCTATILKNVVNQGLLVVDIELRRDNMVDEGSQVGIGLRRIHFCYCIDDLSQQMKDEEQ